MKIIKLSIVFIAFCSVISLAVYPLAELDKHNHVETVLSSDSNKSLLYKKWKLSHYNVLDQRYNPEETEANDYIKFNADGTYISVSKGIYQKGKYTWEKSAIKMTAPGEKGALKFLVKKITTKELVLVIDDPSDPDARYVSIHFKS